MNVNRKDLTKNRFLGNKLEILQFAKGFRATMDSVLVAASVPAENRQKVLELGCGNGVAICCLLHRVEGLEIFGVETNRDAVELCRENLYLNKFKATIIRADISNKVEEINYLLFDHVFMNPPYFLKGSGKKPEVPSASLAKVESLKLSRWISLASSRCKPKGKITIIQRVDRLPEILECLKHSFGKVMVLPLSSFEGTIPKTVIVQATKSSRAPFQLLKTKFIHTKDPESDKVYYSGEFKKILRDGDGLKLN